MKSKDFIIKESKVIPFNNQNLSIKQKLVYAAKTRELTIFSYLIRRSITYIITLFALIAPSNKLRIFFNKLKGVNIAKGVYIGMFVQIDNAYPEFIYLEENVSVNAGSMLIAHFNPMPHFRRTVLSTVSPIVIRKGAMLGVKTVVLQGVDIGEYSIISSGSVVISNVERCTIVRGNPATNIGKVRI